MTRETKLGLIVAGSFLALIGGVMGVKTLFHTPPTAVHTDAKTVAQVQPQATESDKPAIPETPSTELVHSPAPPTLPRVHIQPNGDEEPLAIPADTLDQTRRVTFTAPKKNTPIMPAVDDLLPPLNAPDKGSVKIELPPLGEPIAEQPKPKFTARTQQPKTPAQDENIIPVSGETVALPPLDAPTTPKVPVVAPKKEEAAPLEPLVIPAAPLIGKEPKEPAPQPKKQDTTLPPLDLDPQPMEAAPKVNTLTIRPTAKEPPAPPTPINVPMPKEEPKRVEFTVPGKHNLPPQNLEPVAKESMPTPVETKATELKEPAPTKVEIKPLELKETGAIKAEAKPNDDTNYDEDLHTFRSGENYRTISKLHYRSEAYAVALDKYNKAHPSGQADYIRIPPVWILEKRYGSDVNNGVQAANFAPPVAAETTPPQQTTPNVYVVPANGEFLAEIAQKTLGNEDAWQRIKELNKNINEVKKIPGGTRLLMPVEARNQ